MKKISSLVCLLAFFYGLLSVSFANEMPPEAKDLLDSLPNQRISLKLVVESGVKSSDTFKSVKADLKKIESPILESKSALDVEVFASGVKSNDETEPQSQFSPNKRVSMTYTLGAQTYFRSGTNFLAQLSHGKNELGFASTPSTTDFYETKGRLTLTQNLWKDGFGYATRQAVQEAEKNSEALRFTFQESRENWMLMLIDQYYAAWLSQSRVRASVEGAERRERLLRITNLKVKRGTAEIPDLLQIESAKINSDNELLTAKQELERVWTNLVLTLKFPRSWISVDPLFIPMELDEPSNLALELCQRADPNKNSTSMKFHKLVEAAQFGLNKAYNSRKPSTQLKLDYATNGIDTDSSPSITEARTSKHPAWTVGIEMSYPISGYAAKSAKVTALANLEKAEALASKARDDLVSDWSISCAKLQRDEVSKKDLLRALLKQLERVKLEERRFRIGKVQTMNVIQAGDDATAADLKLRNIEIDSRQTSWKIIQLAGEMNRQLDLLEKANPSQ